MSTSSTGSIGPYSFHKRSGFQVSILNHNTVFLNTGSRFQKSGLVKIHMMARSSLQPGPPLPSAPAAPPPTSWKRWLFGMLLALVVPIWRNKLSPLQLLKNKVETAVEAVDTVVEIVEKVAEEVEKVAEEIADHLPEGGKLKATATMIENIAKVTAKDAHLADEILDKVEEIEKEVTSLVEPMEELEKAVESLVPPTVKTDKVKVTLAEPVLADPISNDTSGKASNQQ